MGRYVPPDQEGIISGNRLNNKHALGARARKSNQGILTVRFEMPFPIWCTTCPKPAIIGQGVRFNAEKKKVGNYFSTPIYSFRMKHAACGGWIEIRTDPKNTLYVVVEGAKKRDLGEDKLLDEDREGGMVIMTEEERERVRNDAFANLESKVDDRKMTRQNHDRIEELKKTRQRDWQDPYEASRKLRKGFRADRKVRAKKAEKVQEIQDKMSLEIDLLPEIEADTQRARGIDFGDPNGDRSILRAASRPLFASISGRQALGKPNSGTRNRKIKDAKRDALYEELRSNTLAAMDPFSHDNSRAISGLSKPVVKRKQHGEARKESKHTLDPDRNDITEAGTTKGQTDCCLVDYDSD